MVPVLLFQEGSVQLCQPFDIANQLQKDLPGDVPARPDLLLVPASGPGDPGTTLLRTVHGPSVDIYSPPVSGGARVRGDIRRHRVGRADPVDRHPRRDRHRRARLREDRPARGAGRPHARQDRRDDEVARRHDDARPGR